MNNSFAAVSRMIVINFNEWIIEKNWQVVRSKELNAFAYVNAFDHKILVNGSDFHYTKLIQEFGKSIDELYSIFLYDEQMRLKTLGGQSAIYRPETRGELYDKIRDGIPCEVLADQVEFTTIALYSLQIFKKEKFKFRSFPSELTGWAIFERLDTLEYEELVELMESKTPIIIQRSYSFSHKPTFITRVNHNPGFGGIVYVEGSNDGYEGYRIRKFHQ